MSLMTYLTCVTCKTYKPKAILSFYKGAFICEDCLKEDIKSVNPPTMNPDPSLKPCPFCGGEAKESVFPLHTSIGISVECTTSHCAGSTTTFYIKPPPGEFGTPLKNLLEIHEKAIDQWNTRA